MLTFDHDSLGRELDALEARHRLIFAVACAERTYQLYVLFSEATGDGDVACVRRTLDTLWDACATSQQFGQALPFLEVSTSLAPGDDVPRAKRHLAGPLAEDSVWAIDSACRLLLTSISEHAVSAAYFAYEATDYLAHSLEQDLFGCAWTMSDILARPYVQEELQCQISNLAVLKRLTVSEVPEHVHVFSQDAKQQSLTLAHTARSILRRSINAKTPKPSAEG